MSPKAPSLRCTGCGREVAEPQALPFRCPAAGEQDGVDHLLARALPPEGAEFPLGEDEQNPFLRFRRLSHSYALARSRGMSDADYVALVAALDARIAEVDGRGFLLTPLRRSPPLAEALGLQGEVWVKDETGNVAGSHKARHLFGLAVYLEVAERVGLPVSRSRPLAIASCGNAALAAAIVARAAGRPLQVFIPDWASAQVVRRLRELGAELLVCARRARDPPGDPTFHAFRRAVAEGALPFTCQGSENGLTLDGGMTLGFELASQLQRPLDRLVVQVGGGALGSACVQALRWAHRLGQLSKLPTLHVVQTAKVAPLARAWRTSALRLLSAREGRGEEPAAFTGSHAELARELGPLGGAELTEALAHAAAHRPRYMWPIEAPAQSVASGILDDETYDWLELLRGLLETGGHPLLASEEALVKARALGQAAGFAVDATGSAGLGGLLDAAPTPPFGPGEQVGVLFTGVQR